MPTSTALTLDTLASALRRACTLGLARTQDAVVDRDERVLALGQAIEAVRRVSAEPVALGQLLRSAIDRCPDTTARAQMPTMLDLERSGHPAAERYEAVAVAIGREYHTVRREKREAWSAQVAEALLQLVVEAGIGMRTRFDVSAPLRRELEALCTWAALQLAALRRPDGAWSGSSGSPEGELSTTAWAAIALHKVLGGTWASAVLRDTLEWVATHHDERRGAFGVRHAPGSPPGVRPEAHIVPAPRVTASAIKLVRQFDGPRMRRVGTGLRYLVEHQARDGIGWSRSGHPGDPADLLTTVYVLDALLALAPDLDDIAAVLDGSEYAPIAERFDGVVRRGLEWVCDRRRGGGWSDDDGGEDPDPYVTAQVLGFAWQALPNRVEPTIVYLERQVQDGGIPAVAGGPAEIAPTAITLLGILRATNGGHERLLRKAASFLGRKADEPVLRLDVFAATFALLLGEPAYAWLTGEVWQSRARESVTAILTGVAAGAAPAAVAAAAVAALEPSHRHVEPVLASMLATATG